LIAFDRLWRLMRERGISTYALRETCGVDSKTVRRLKANENMETKTLDKLCAALHCRLEEIAEYRPATEGSRAYKPQNREADPMKDLYDYPQIYDERWNEGAHRGYREHYRQMFSGKEITDILDCSIGTGNLTFCLAELGYEISGSDLNAAMLEEARKKAEAAGIRCPLTQCDFRELAGHFDRKFSCVMSSGNALAHVCPEDVARTLRQMDQLVKDGGYLYLDSRSWDKELREKKRFHGFQLPFVLPNGDKIHFVQVWDYNPDGTVTINILNAYENETGIYREDVWEEHYHPFSINLVKDTLRELGYDQIEVCNIPCSVQKDFEDIDWYCLMAHKAK
jgi:glycine/sarcosine N-methyltransferase